MLLYLVTIMNIYLILLTSNVLKDALIHKPLVIMIAGVLSILMAQLLVLQIAEHSSKLYLAVTQDMCLILVQIFTRDPADMLIIWELTRNLNKMFHMKSYILLTLIQLLLE